MANEFEEQLLKIINAASAEVSTVIPSEWAEQNRMMPTELTSAVGMFDYWNSPYTREIVNCLDEGCSADTIFVKKAAQIGFSASVIENGIGWIISENPGNTLLLVGHADNIKDSTSKIESVIDNSDIRHLIRSSSGKKFKNSSGDTDQRKEFQGGYLKIGLTNKNSLRNMTMRYMFIDDYDAMKGSTEDAGSTFKLIEQRAAAMSKKKKIFFISTPERSGKSNIQEGFLKGDQRKFYIPCPCCDEFITLEWEVDSKIEGEKAGMTWAVDKEGILIPETVGYTCQECGGFFDDSDKMTWLNKGVYKATAKPERPNYRSYLISALYAPIFMDGWDKYVRDWIGFTPLDGERTAAQNEEYKSFLNLVLGDVSSHESKKLDSRKLQNNCRKYSPGIIPEKQSIADGNGKIVLVTCGSDLNGKDDILFGHNEDDARLDYEIVAYSENGATYSIDHGSIGTFVNKDRKSNDRLKFTYKHGAVNSVWPLFEKILTTRIKKDTGGDLPIFATGLDVGHLQNYAMQFISNSQGMNVFAVKGDSPIKANVEHGDFRSYRKSKEISNLFLIDSNHVKDIFHYDTQLKWDPKLHSVQPFGFLNFPHPTKGKYDWQNFFSHFEAEERVNDAKSLKFIWKKRNESVQNHLFDCRLYANVSRDILLDIFFFHAKVKNGTWGDYVRLVTKKAH